MLNNKRVLITGGTGSFGKAFVKKILINYDIKRLVIFSRDELKQYEMSNDLFFKKYKSLRYFLGDIRDKTRLLLALKDIDIVVHAAALKHVPAAEYNPFEFIKTNVVGAQNIIEASIDRNVKKVIALSTDKAVEPINLYGATKLCSDKLFLAANNIKGSQKIDFSVVRYGNVLNSRGSVLPYLEKNKHQQTIPLTHKDMTRFTISLDEGVNTVIWALKNSTSGDVIVPKLNSYKLTDLARAVCGQKKYKFTGIREGEKIHEDMISKNENGKIIDVGKYFIITKNIKKYKNKNYKVIKQKFSYNSKENNFLTIDELKKIIKQIKS